MRINDVIILPVEIKNTLFYKKISSDIELIEHAKIFSYNLSVDKVPITSRNRYTVICSTIFAEGRSALTESAHISAGKQLVKLLGKLDQFNKLNLVIGSKISIINLQLQGDTAELWGFTTPKIITNITRDSSEHSIKQFEFNNDPNDVWPRTENIEYNGHFLMYSAFFGDKKSTEYAITMLGLQMPDELTFRNHIKTGK